VKKLENIREVFKTMEHRKPSSIFCPKCANPDVKLISSLDGWLTPKKYICEKCGYYGPLIMELEKTEEEKGSA
jgi:predicted RNA-binding Zn-ribbon protein involved in translation (DUF1610 family)